MENKIKINHVSLLLIRILLKSDSNNLIWQNETKLKLLIKIKLKKKFKKIDKKNFLQINSMLFFLLIDNNEGESSQLRVSQPPQKKIQRIRTWATDIR